MRIEALLDDEILRRFPTATQRSGIRGYDAVLVDGKWLYVDDLSSIYRRRPRPCARCGKVFPEGTPDACLGKLPGVKFACCGHGQSEEAYISFEDGRYIEGSEAIEKYRIKEKET